MPIEYLLLGLVALTLLLTLAGLLRQRRPTSDGATLKLALAEAFAAHEQALRRELAEARTEAAETAREQRRELRETLEQFGSAIQGSTVTLNGTLSERLAMLTLEQGTAAAQLRTEVKDTMTGVGATQAETMKALSAEQRERLNQVSAALAQLTERSAAQAEQLRLAVEGRLDAVRADNATKLEEMRATVDEKLNATLEARLGASFAQVSERLEQVHRGIGEMQSLATGVGDLKRVLTNVKSRGTWGEVSLGALLEQMLTPDQYARNVKVKPTGNELVEFAIRLPGEAGAGLWLPIDAKFPHEAYDRLSDAAELGDPAAVEAAARELEKAIRVCAKDVCQKYVAPPATTDFAILFLPTEGLFAEVIRRPGLVEALQREFRVVAAGPTTLSALLTSLRMGFRTLAIQKRTSEITQVLGAVKTEFGKYGLLMDKVRKKLGEAQETVDQVAVRNRAMDRALRGVEQLPEGDAAQLLALDQIAPLVAEEEEAAG